MKPKIKYFFSRLILLLVSLHTLNVSIDYDYLTYDVAACNVESYDDIDSFSELIVEKICNDDNLLKETENDDHNPTQKQIFKYPVFYVGSTQLIKLPAAPTATTTNATPAIDNARFQPEDYTKPNYTPPDHLAC